MPSNIVQHSFANRVRVLIHAHPGISDIAISSILGRMPGRVHQAVRDDQKMKVTDSYIVTSKDANGHEVYHPRDDRMPRVAKPRGKRASGTVRADQFPVEMRKPSAVPPLVLNTIPTLKELITPTRPDPLTCSNADRVAFIEREATQLMDAVQAAATARIEAASQDLAAAVWARYDELMAEALSMSLG